MIYIYGLLQRHNGADVPHYPADYFEQGEELIWQGAPEPRWRSYSLPIVMTIASTPSVLFALFVPYAAFYPTAWTNPSTAPGDIVFSVIISAILLVFAASLTFASWKFILCEHKHVRYALTNKRAYIAKSFRKQSVSSYPIQPDDVITIDRGKFDNVRFPTGYGTRLSNKTMFDSQGFEGIADGPKVYALVRHMQSEMS